MEEESNVLSIGRELLDFSREAEGKARHGRISEIFPYIYEASKRIGIRSISRWLSEQGQPISHSTISRALANQEPHWEAFAELVEPHARRIENSYQIDKSDFLFDDGEIYDGRIRNVSIGLVLEEAIDDDTARQEFYSIDAAKHFLEKQWFILSKSTRWNCMKYLIEKELDTEKVSEKKH